MTNCIGKIIKSLPIFHVPFLNASYWQNIIPWEIHLQKQQLRHRNNIFPVSLLLTSKKHLPNKAFNKMYLIVVTVYVTQREINSILRTKNRDTRILCYVFLRKFKYSLLLRQSRKYTQIPVFCPTRIWYRECLLFEFFKQLW